MFRYAVATARCSNDPNSLLKGALVTPRASHYAAILDPKTFGALLRSIDSYDGNLLTRYALLIAPHVFVRPGELIGLGWVASGNGDFALGPTLIEVKHTERNFGSGDFRQILMYWLLKYARLKYARSIENNGDFWSEILLLNPRRNTALFLNYAYLLQSASARLNRVELVELLRSAVSQEIERL